MNRGRSSGGRGGGGGGGGRCHQYHGFRGRSPNSAGRSFQRYVPVGGRSNEPSAVDESGSSRTQKQNPEILDDPDRRSYASGGSRNMLQGAGKSTLTNNDLEMEYQTPKQQDIRDVVSPGYGSDVLSLSSNSKPSAGSRKFQWRDAGEESRSSPSLKHTPHSNAMHKTKDPSQTVGSGFRDDKEIQSFKETSENDEFENSDDQHKRYSFDICLQQSAKGVRLKPSLLAKNRARRNEIKHNMEGDNIKELRSGMIILKGYLALVDQVNLIKACRDLGRGSGGFYEPGYVDGATLHLRMMCLGKHWDPQSGLYVDERPIDGAKPPPIPDEFQRLVKGVIQDCHNYLESNSKAKNARDALPSMSPNICIINYYTTTGKLGLHQDKDESQESLHKGLPVVSFSIGDRANFLYGDSRDIDKADKVELESGDVLVFGGKSRNVFHGVTSIIPDAARRVLLEETNFRKGRLNLTFREY